MSRDHIRDQNSRALQAEELNQRRVFHAGSLGADYSDRAMGASGGMYQTLRQQRMTDKASKRNMWGNIARGLLIGGATFLGGPGAGMAAAGATAGRGS